MGWRYTSDMQRTAKVEARCMPLSPTNERCDHFPGRPLSAKQLLMGDNVSAPVAADALYTALDDLMARTSALSAERRWGALLTSCSWTSLVWDLHHTAPLRTPSLLNIFHEAGLSC